MLESLLVQRFNLKTHWEKHVVPAYVIVPAKAGPKLREAAEPPGPKVRVRHRGQVLVMTFESSPISEMARSLSEQVHRPLVDNSGLKGDFDFTLEFVPESLRMKTDAGGADGPSIFTAVQEQLGLKLEARNALVRTLIVDGADELTAN